MGTRGHSWPPISGPGILYFCHLWAGPDGHLLNKSWAGWAWALNRTVGVDWMGIEEWHARSPLPRTDYTQGTLMIACVRLGLFGPRV